jgi:hypothetical protein
MKLILSPILLLVVSLAMQTSASGQDGFKIFVTDDDVTRELDLKATEGQNGQVNEVSGFTIKPESVVQLHQNENLVVFTSTNEPDRIEKVKVTDQNGELIELTKIGGNEWSLQGFDNGIYLLDVITNMPQGGRGAYETVLVILAPNASDLNPTQVIAQVVNIEVNVREEVFEDDDEDRPTPEPSICYFDPDNEACDPLPGGGCPPGSHFNEDERCVPDGKCPDGYGRLDDDETGRCYPERDIKRCPDGSIIHAREQCPAPQPTPTPQLTPEPTPESPTEAAPEPTPEPQLESPTNELTANCGGVPCTPTEKEDSTMEGEEDPGSAAEPGSNQKSLPPSP